MRLIFQFLILFMLSDITNINLFFYVYLLNINQNYKKKGLKQIILVNRITKKMLKVIKLDILYCKNHICSVIVSKQHSLIIFQISLIDANT